MDTLNPRVTHEHDLGATCASSVPRIVLHDHDLGREPFDKVLGCLVLYIAVSCLAAQRSPAGLYRTHKLATGLVRREHVRFYAEVRVCLFQNADNACVCQLRRSTRQGRRQRTVWEAFKSHVVAFETVA